jgi:hypothetical protein
MDLISGIFFHFPILFLMLANLLLFSVIVYKLRLHRSSTVTVKVPRR